MRLMRRLMSKQMGVGQASSRLPRAAVAAVIRHEINDKYLLVQRGRAPLKGQWSLPGGKLEGEETLLEGAVREVEEETSLPRTGLRVCPLAVSATDFIDDMFHYVIVQVFMQATAPVAPVKALDDADDCGWFALQEIQAMQSAGRMGGKVAEVIERVHAMHAAGLLLTHDVVPTIP